MTSNNIQKNKKVVVLGATGFVGKNISTVLNPFFEVVTTSRSKVIEKNTIYFDILDEASWAKIGELQPDVVINSIGYGVVKWQQDVHALFNTNYLYITKFFDFLFKINPSVFLIQIGTAFEYDLSQSELYEQSLTHPRTFYGISKLLSSKYLFEKYYNKRMVILRPFNMFGPFEDASKIIPALIIAQKEKQRLDLSDGAQRRDFLYVQDLALMIKEMICNEIICDEKVINVGLGRGISLKEIAKVISENLPFHNPNMWNWGAIPQRSNESNEFVNASKAYIKYGFKESNFHSSIQETIKYYWNK